MLDNLVLISSTFSANTQILDTALTEFGDFGTNLHAILANNADRDRSHHQQPRSRHHGCRRPQAGRARQCAEGDRSGVPRHLRLLAPGRVAESSDPLLPERPAGGWPGVPTATRAGATGVGHGHRRPGIELERRRGRAAATARGERAVRSFRDMNPYVVGLVSMILIGAITGAAFGVGLFHLLEHTYDVRVEFSDASGLKTGDAVRVAGVKSGRVTDIKADRQNGLVVVDLVVNKGVHLSTDSDRRHRARDLARRQVRAAQEPAAAQEAVSRGSPEERSTSHDPGEPDHHALRRLQTDSRRHREHQAAQHR